MLEPLVRSCLPYLCLTAVLAYVTWLALSRLILSPIASFPGPRLAAFTFWYEFYYDVVCKGRYTWKIKQLHSNYGPVVRINPFEIHIDDPTFYHDVYVGNGRRTDKWEWSAKMFGTSKAAVGTIGHELHGSRRRALNPFFSKRSVTQLEPLIQAHIDLLRTRLGEIKDSNQPANLSDAFACLSADTIGSYAFGKNYDLVTSPDFSPGWRKFMMDLSAGTMLMKQFGWAYEVLNAFPAKLTAILHPLMRQLANLRCGIESEILTVQREIKQDNAATQGHPTIFHKLLESTLPPSELTLPRLSDEALTLIGAGTITTAHTLATITYHLLADATKVSQLQAEIAGIPDHKPSRAQLEQLPYLSACISEGLRLSFGVSHRLQRISPDKELVYSDKSTAKTWLIPRGVPVSMTQMFIHMNPHIFKRPAEFLPERWLDNSDGALAQMRRWLVPFSRGTRSCVGMNLAYAELFLTVGALFAPRDRGGIEMELYQTDYSDVEVIHDFFNPSARLDSKGVRVVVKSSACGVL